MPKPNLKPTLNIDLLHPQSNPEKLPAKLLRWGLSTGRYIIVFVELIVLVAFISRFKLDADLANYKEKIEQQIPYIQSLKSDEILIRQLQKQLSTIKTLKASSFNYAPAFNAIASQTPQGITLTNVSLDTLQGKTDLKIVGEALNVNELATLIFGLRETSGFSNIVLSNIALENDVISFTITGAVNLSILQEDI